VKQILKSEPSVRFKAVDWTFEGMPASLSAEKMNAWFRSAWNGMRRLPYSDEDIAQAFGSIVALGVADFGPAIDPKVNEERFSNSFGSSLNVGFSYEDNSGSKGCTSRAAIGACLRADIADLPDPEHRHRAAGKIEELFKVVYNPALVCDFERFLDVFAHEIIPAQVLLERSSTLFNPARVKIFGNP